MKSGSVPSSWFKITGTWLAGPNLRLLEAVLKQEINPRDLTKVAEVWREIEAQRVDDLNRRKVAR